VTPPDDEDAKPEPSGRSSGWPSIDPRIRQRRVDIQRSRGRRRLRWVVGAASVVGLVVVVIAVLHTPLFSARVVSVAGVHPHTSAAAIETAAGLTGHPPLISVDPAATAAKVERLPFIATAQVHRHWPDGVTVTVTERVPTVVMGGPGNSWSVLDDHGRTLEVVPTRPPGLVVMTVNTAEGPLHPAAVGDTLPGASSFALAVSRSLPPAFSGQVLSITEAPNATVSLWLNSRITVLLGTNSDLRAKYEDVAAVIAHASLHGATAIDVSVPQSPTVAY
jgi:cell division protein FtsQ